MDSNSYFTQHVDYLFTPSFFIKMLFLVDDFVVKIHIVLKLYVGNIFEARVWLQIVNLNGKFLVILVKKP